MNRQLSPPADPEQLRVLTGQYGKAVELAMRCDLDETLADNDSLLAEALDYALFNGGKRVRPLLVILSAEVCGCRQRLVYKLASAFEYLHVATLIHDDVIDNAQERRGRQSLVQAYGMAVAILTGDWLHAQSMRLVGQLTGHNGLQLFTRSTTAMVDGEFRQLRCAGDSKVTEEQYFAIIHRKTAGLIGAACEIGALFAGANKNQQAALKNYGINLGCAFQIIDDLLDYLGDYKSTGKKIGNDFAEGKLTLPLLRSLAAAAPEDRKTLMKLFAGQRQLPENFQKTKNLINKYNGFVSARNTAEQIISAAVSHLDMFYGTSENGLAALTILNHLAYYILQRDK